MTKALLSVRETARLLGVHENTVRNWQQRGLLRAVRLPSGVRRFEPAEVERLRAEMFAPAVAQPAARGLTRRRLRPNVAAGELRRAYVDSTPAERLRETAELSLAVTTLAGYGARRRDG